MTGENVTAGQIWSVTLEGTPYSYTVGDAVPGYGGDLITPEGVAAGLANEINTDAGATYEGNVNGSIFTVSDSSTFTDEYTVTSGPESGDAVW